MDENQEQSASQEGQQTSDDVTLDQVYEKFNVEEAASDFSPQVQQPAQKTVQAPQPQIGAEIPDPVLDPAGFKAYHSKFDAALQTLTQTQQQLVAERMRSREEADIKQAVSVVREKVGGEVDEDFIEIALGQKARKDAKFLSIYNNRAKNPAAWKAALGAVGNELKTKYQFRTDPQIAENVRAAKQSTQSTLTKRGDDSANPLESKLAGVKSEVEFAREWERLRSGM